MATSTLMCALKSLRILSRSCVNRRYRLRLVAVDGERGEAFVFERLGQHVAHALRGGEDERLVRGRLLAATQETDHLSLLALVFAEDDVLRDVGVDGQPLVAHADGDRPVLAEVPRELFDFARPSRTPEERLPLGLEVVDDGLDLGQEAHVEHAVCFVEDEDEDLVELDVSALDEVVQSAGRGDEQVCTSREVVALGVRVCASVDAGDVEVDGLDEGLGALVDLADQFSRGRHHEGARFFLVVVELVSEPYFVVPLAELFLVLDGHEHGQDEGQGLARAGLRDADDVEELQRDGDGVGLDLRGPHVAERLEDREEGGREVYLVEVDDGGRLVVVVVGRDRDEVFDGQLRLRVRRAGFGAEVFRGGRPLGRVLRRERRLPRSGSSSKDSCSVRGSFLVPSDADNAAALRSK